MALLDDYFSEAELALELHLNIATVQRWRKKHTGPVHTMVGRTILYRKQAVKDWLLKQEEKPLPADKPSGRRAGHNQFK
jgi:hypothetical protein